MRNRLPPGQVLTEKWPVLTYGETPRVDRRTWTFRCFGLVKEEVSWTWKEFLELPRVEVTSDVHCVTRWSRFDNRWEGVAVSEILRRVRVLPEAVAVMGHAEQGYTTNLRLTDLHEEGVLLALKHDGLDLSAEHGGPCRLVAPKLYAGRGPSRREIRPPPEHHRVAAVFNPRTDSPSRKITPEKSDIREIFPVQNSTFSTRAISRWRKKWTGLGR